MLNGVNIMFNKKCKLFLITLVFMLSISAVAAVDTNSSDDIIAGDIDEEPPSAGIDNISSDDLLSSSESEDVISNVEEPTVVNADNSNVSLLSAANTTKKVTLIKAKDMTKTFGTITDFTATFYDDSGNPLKNAKVKFQIKGVNYTKKTNSKGVAKLPIGLSPGDYIVYIYHPNGYSITKVISVQTTIIAPNFSKHYLSSKSFKATFYNKKGKLLKNKNIKFYANGKYYVKKTNSKGVASINIISKPGVLKIVSINTDTGEKKKSNLQILHTLSANKMTVFSDRTSTFKVTLYKNEKLVKNAKVYISVKGNSILAKTNSKGVASFDFKLSKGTYTFKSSDPYTGDKISTKVTVKLATIQANDMIVHENKTSTFTATVLKSNGKVAANAQVKIKLNGTTHTVKSNSKGVVSFDFNLDQGSYKIVLKDLSSGYSLTKKITVLKSNVGMEYNQYGVSADGKTILAIGRASASGEMSKYGYSFHMTEFLRVCPYCGSNELYWSIFWAGSETADYGVFPATGHKEGGSAEGHIFCAHCDCDWSVYGNNHGTGGDLKVVSPTVASSKEAAYLLKSGNYILV